MTTPAPYAALRETHAGLVLLLGDRAYKLKKPVDFGFLDFRTLQARRQCCTDEVDLNRRLAPDVYLGVGELTDPLGGPGEPAVVMRRMPEHTRLSSLLRDGAPLDGVIDRLARMMADFHSRARRGPQIDEQARRDALHRRWQATFDQLRPFHGTVLNTADALEVEHLVHQFLAGRQPLFDDRIRRRRIVDGHGDLLCDDIFCLPDGPRPLDCLEFDEHLRFVDGLDDIAFLAMDLEHLQAPALATQLLDRYTDYAADPAPTSLLHHYIAYRAYVRAKVCCLRHQQGADQADEARVYADLALRHLRAGVVRLILIGGLPGSGKSTVAAAASDALHAVLLSSDQTRKEIHPSTLTGDTTPYRAGLYDTDHTTRTYRELLHRADELLGAGETVILDASWTHAPFRSDAGALARRRHADLIAVRCTAPRELREHRISHRAPGPSDATPAIAQHMSRDADPWPGAHTLNTTGTPDAALQRLLALLTSGSHPVAAEPARPPHQGDPGPFAPIPAQAVPEILELKQPSATKGTIMSGKEDFQTGVEARHDVAARAGGVTAHDLAVQEYLLTVQLQERAGRTHTPTPGRAADAAGQLSAADSGQPAPAPQTAADHPGQNHRAGPVIVVGIDGSDGAATAARWAADEAVRRHATVRLVHAYELPPNAGYPDYHTPPNDLHAKVRQQSEQLLDSVAAELTARHPDLTVETRIVYERPVVALSRTSEDAQLTVVGSDDATRISGVLLGSVALGAASSNPAPVAVIHAGQSDRTTGPVVVGVDGSPVSDAAVEFAFEEAAIRDTDLIAVHAWNDIYSDSHGAQTLLVDPAVLKQEERAVLGERLTGWRDKYPDVAVSQVVLEKRPTTALLGYGSTAQLIIVGSHGRGGFAGMLLGSTSHALITHATCPVIVVRTQPSTR